MESKKRWRWLMLLIAVLWTALSWRWYTCQIKGFCDVEAPAPATPETSEIVDRVAPKGTACDQYLQGPIRLGHDNDAEEVRKLETFLKEYEDATIDVDGTYSEQDERSVRAFQEKHSADILTPWDIAEPTGHVMKTTTQKINEVHCAAR